ncbi:MAG: ribonuclease 3 [marine bacterium B5-7]|nr:MAG: ribonuclease 3 [marine bacterium B5-7]
MTDTDRLQQAIDYQFDRTDLLDIALTHRSARGINNERLEFLGDSILGMVIAENLFQRFGDASEGQLSRARASIVKGATLARVSRMLSIGDYLKLGSGELKSGGFDRDSIIADAVEALIGAIYLDSNFDIVRKVILRWFAVELATADPASVSKDSKTRLQELLQSQGLELPSYDVIEIEGASHNRTFVIDCHIAGYPKAFRGEGTSKRKAEQNAAQRALEMIGTSLSISTV